MGRLRPNDLLAKEHVWLPLLGLDSMQPACTLPSSGFDFFHSLFIVERGYGAREAVTRSVQAA